MITDAVDRSFSTPAVSGDFPLVICRAFDEESYANDFVERGRFRMAKLQHYKHIEDNARRDTEEGQGSLHAPGSVVQVQLDKNRKVVGAREVSGNEHISSWVTNAIYVLCCSEPDGSGGFSHLEHFGAYVVCISDPRQFCQDLTDYLWAGPAEFACLAEYVTVRYDKHAIAKIWPSKREIVSLPYTQKPDSFSGEREVRIVAIPGIQDDEAHEFLMIDLGRKLPYVELLKSVAIDGNGTGVAWSTKSISIQRNL